jgi:hypothetical protein
MLTGFANVAQQAPVTRGFANAPFHAVRHSIKGNHGHNA